MKHISNWSMLTMITNWVKTYTPLRKSIEALLEAGRERGLKVITEKTKYMLVSLHHNAGQNHNLNPLKV